MPGIVETKSCHPNQDENQKQVKTLKTTNPTKEEASPDPHFTYTHPLASKWMLWYKSKAKQHDWQDHLHKVAHFETVEEFWALYNHLRPASKLEQGCSYMVFKEGIQPAWEDKENEGGGCWQVSLESKPEVRNTMLNAVWMDMLLLMIDEAFVVHSDKVCGAVVNVKAKFDKLGIWIKSCSDSAVGQIGGMLKHELNHLYPRVGVCHYYAHEDSCRPRPKFSRLNVP